MRAARLKIGLNQTEFWGRVGVTQSSGSRYEADTLPVPQTVAALLELAYGKKPLSVLAKLRKCKVSELVA